MKSPASLPFALAALVAGCVNPSAPGATGSAQLFLEPEATIPGGVAAGPGDEAIQDGWTVRYARFLIAFGNFRAARSGSSDRIGDPSIQVVDLRNLQGGGLVVASFDRIAAARWDRVGFDLPNAGAAAKAAKGTAQADLDLLVKNGWSLYFEGEMTNDQGKSCRPELPTDCVAAKKISFKWGLAAGTSFDDCAPPMGDAGFAVPAGGTVQIKPTIHGDHWFFANVSQGAEVTRRLAQWVANADLDRNGETTLAELKQTRASDLFKPPTYNLSGALLPIVTGHDFLEAQARTLGDFQGSGECPTRKKL